MQIAKYYNISFEKFFPSIGMSYANFKGKAKNTTLNSDSIVEILSKYPDIDITWLITGVGEMLKHESAQPDHSITKSDNKTSDILSSTNAYALIIEQYDKRIADKEELIISLKAQIELLKSQQKNDVPRDGGAMNADAK